MAQAQRCLSYKADGFICGKMTTGGHRCGTHENQYRRNGPFREDQCEFARNGRRCPDVKMEGSLICEHHHNHFAELRRQRAQRERAMEELREHRRQRDERVEEIVTGFRGRNPRPAWQDVIREMHTDTITGNQTREIAYIVTLRYTASQIIVWPPTIVEQYWEWLDGGMVGPEPQNQPLPQFDNLILPRARPVRAAPAPPAARLQALARDTQNVHTREVAEQTNESTKKLLEEFERSCTTKNMRAPDWFAAKWLTERYGRWDRIVRVVTDMQHWYATHTCRKTNDHLYKKCLDGLYMLIKKTTDEEVRKELYKRAFEECEEAVGMCCEGHMSRVCNVMVGFDDAFKPPVPIGELLQNAIARIAQLEKETSEKIAEANKVFDELNVPAPDRAVWLEALEGY